MSDIDFTQYPEYSPEYRARKAAFFNALKPYNNSRKADDIIEAYWAGQKSDAETVARLREAGIFSADEKQAVRAAKLGVREAKREAWANKLTAWASARDKTADQFKAECSAALLKVIAKFEIKPMTDDCRAMVNATKKQVLGA